MYSPASADPRCPSRSSPPCGPRSPRASGRSATRSCCGQSAYWRLVCWQGQSHWALVRCWRRLAWCLTHVLWCPAPCLAHAWLSVQSAARRTIRSGRRWRSTRSFAVPGWERSSWTRSMRSRAISAAATSHCRSHGSTTSWRPTAADDRLASDSLQRSGRSRRLRRRCPFSRNCRRSPNPRQPPILELRLAHTGQEQRIACFVVTEEHALDAIDTKQVRGPASERAGFFERFA